MVLIDIIKQLQAEGFEIKYRKRTDGGYIITAINGVKYSGAKGNKAARQITGATISEARIQQMTFNVKKFIKGHKKPKVDVPDDLVQELRKVQKLMRKTQAKGKITKRKLREQYAQGGRRQARRYLREASKYSRGIAYEDNVMWLKQRMETDANAATTDYPQVARTLFRMADIIWNNRDIFKEEWINPTYQYLYEIEKGIVHKDSVRISSGLAGIKSTINFL